MRLSRILLVIVYLLRCHVARSIAVPTKVRNQVLTDGGDITPSNDNDGDVPTEEPFLKKCIVDGKAYSHSQTISSYDSNSHCMCVAGDVFCWWQDYNSDTASLLDTSSLQSTTIKNNYTSSLEMSVNIANGFEASRDSKSSVDQQEHVQEINTTLPTTMPPVAICLVMGREYRQGETLPHSTGNCVECSCGSEGRVECSPKDCVALRPEILVAPDIPEAPDGDFEVFNLARDRGIDESF